MTKNTELLIYVTVLILIIGGIVAQHEWGVQHENTTHTPLKVPTGQEVVSIGACKQPDVTTVAKFEMRGNDQILVLKCGTEKIPHEAEQ